MTRKQRRAILIGGGIATLAVAAILVLFALRNTIVFFYTPSDVVTGQKVKIGQRFRLGGLVEEGSVKRGRGTDVEFGVTDTRNTLKVTYSGVLPDLFREKQGVVTEGRLIAPGRFKADSVLAKHDETYMPPEVAKALKEQGVWQGSPGKSKGAASK